MKRYTASLLLLYDGTLSAKNQCLALGRAFAQTSSAAAYEQSLETKQTQPIPAVELHAIHLPLRFSALPALVHGLLFWLLHRIGGEKTLTRWMELEGVKDVQRWRNTAMIIACGRKTAPLSFALSRFLLSSRPMNVQLNHPRCGHLGNRLMFDVIVSPRHDLPNGKPPNALNRYGHPLVLPILGNVTMDRRLAPAVLTGFVEEGDTVVLVGGPTHRDNCTVRSEVIKAIKTMLRELNDRLEGKGVVICSRRTPEEVETWLAQEWTGRFWTQASEEMNPYNEALMVGGRFVVTSDSSSMICDAIATGKRVFIASIPVHSGNKSKFERFQEDVVRQGYCIRLSSSRSLEEMEKNSVLKPPPDETKHIAQVLWARYLRTKAFD